MVSWIVGMFVAVVVVVAGLAIAQKLYYRRIEKENQKFVQERFEMYQRWKTFLKRNLHLLTGPDWRCPDGKKEFIAVAFRDCIPPYLWYELSRAKLSPKDAMAIRQAIWPSGHIGKGGFEISGSKLKVWEPEQVLEELCLPGRGRPFPLAQAGHYTYGATQINCVNFPRLKPEPEKVTA